MHSWVRRILETAIFSGEARRSVLISRVTCNGRWKCTRQANPQMSTLVSQGAPRNTSGARSKGGWIHSVKCLSRHDAVLCQSVEPETIQTHTYRHQNLPDKILLHPNHHPLCSRWIVTSSGLDLHDHSGAAWQDASQPLPLHRVAQ